MYISKYFFKDFKNNLQNLRYLRQIPFVTFSDLSNPRYDIIEKILHKVNLNKELLISIGKTPAPFGITVDFNTDKELEQLLNSSIYSFCFSDRQKETNFLIKSGLTGVIPICDENHPFLKQLGLEKFSSEVVYDKVLDLLCKMKYYEKIYDYKIALLSWKYRQQWLKWNKKKYV